MSCRPPLSSALRGPHSDPPRTVPPANHQKLRQDKSTTKRRPGQREKAILRADASTRSLPPPPAQPATNPHTQTHTATPLQSCCRRCRTTEVTERAAHRRTAPSLSALALLFFFSP